MHHRCVLYRLEKKKSRRERKRNMLSKVTTNDGIDNYHHQQQIIIGDLLLHSEAKIVVIPVFIQSSPSISSTKSNSSIIHRSIPSSSGTNSSTTIVSCDLKNTSPVKSSHPQSKTFPSKNLRRMRKAGLAIVKELKTKVITPNYTASRTVTVNGIDENDDTNEQTHL